MTRRSKRDDERLADWVDGRMEPRHAERFAAELRVDPELRREAERYRQGVERVRTALRDPAGDGPDAELSARILADVQAAEGTRGRAAGGLPRWLAWGFSAAAAALLVLAFFAARELGRGGAAADAEDAVAYGDEPSASRAEESPAAADFGERAQPDADAGADAGADADADAGAAPGRKRAGRGALGVGGGGRQQRPDAAPAAPEPPAERSPGPDRVGPLRPEVLQRAADETRHAPGAAAGEPVRNSADAADAEREQARRSASPPGEPAVERLLRLPAMPKGALAGLRVASSDPLYLVSFRGPDAAWAAGAAAETTGDGAEQPASAAAGLLERRRATAALRWLRARGFAPEQRAGNVANPAALRPASARALAAATAPRQRGAGSGAVDAYRHRSGDVAFWIAGDELQVLATLSTLADVVAEPGAGGVDVDVHRVGAPAPADDPDQAATAERPGGAGAERAGDAQRGAAARGAAPDPARRYLDADAVARLIAERAQADRTQIDGAWVVLRRQPAPPEDAETDR